MNGYALYVGSVTNAARGKRLLERHGFTVYIGKAPQPQATDGCGYRLLVSGDGERARRLLRENGVRVIRMTSDQE